MAVSLAEISRWMDEQDEAPRSAPQAFRFEPPPQAEPYLPHIKAAEQKYGLPENLLARVIAQESNFNPQAVSPKGARGIAQIMPDYHPDVDPDDPVQAIDYAAGYLRQNADRFGGDWDKAIAAYNAGPGNIEKGIMPAETQDYLKRIKGDVAPVAGDVDLQSILAWMDEEDRRQAAPEPGLIKSVTGDVAGGLIDLGEMYARAGRALPGGPEAGVEGGDFLSKAVVWAEDFRKANPSLDVNPNRKGFSRWFHEGLRAATTSIAAGLPGAAAGAAIGSLVSPGVGTFIGGLLGYATGGATLFGMSEYDSFLEEALNAGVPLDQAEPAAMRSGMYEWSFEFGADLLEGLTLGAGKLASAAGKQALKETVASLFKQGVKSALKRGTGIVGIETASEMLTAGLQAEELQGLGIGSQRFTEAAIHAFGPSLVASMIFAGLGEYGRHRVSKRVQNTLKDPEASPEAREAAVKMVHDAIAPVNEQVAALWQDTAMQAVANNEAIDLDAPIATDAQLDAMIEADVDLGENAANAVAQEEAAAAATEQTTIEEDIDAHEASKAADPLGDDAIAQDIIDKIAGGRTAPVATVPRGQGAEELKAAISDSKTAESEPQTGLPLTGEAQAYELPPKTEGDYNRIKDYAQWFRANRDMSKRSNAARADELDYFLERLSLGNLPMRLARVIKGKGKTWGDERMDRVVDLHEPVRRALADKYGMNLINKAFEDPEYKKKIRAKQKAQEELHQQARELLTEDEYRKVSMTNVLSHYFDPEKKERPTTYGLARRLNTSVEEIREAIALVNEFTDGGLYVGERGVIDGTMFDRDGYDMHRVFQGVIDKRGQTGPKPEEPGETVSTQVETPTEKPQTKREKAEAEYNELVASLTDEQRTALGDLVKETAPKNPSVLTHRIRKKLAEMEKAPEAPQIPTDVMRMVNGRYVQMTEAERPALYEQLADLKKQAQAHGDKFPRGTMLAVNAQMRTLENGAGEIPTFKTIINEAKEELAKLEKPPAPAEEPADSTWWDKELTPQGRREVMAKAGIKLPARVLWRNISDENRARLLRAKESEPPAGKKTGLTPEGRRSLTRLRDHLENKGAGWIPSAKNTSERVSYRIVPSEAKDGYYSIERIDERKLRQIHTGPWNMEQARAAAMRMARMELETGEKPPHPSSIKKTKEEKASVKFEIGDIVRPKQGSGISEKNAGRIEHISRDSQGNESIQTENTGSMHFDAKDWELVTPEAEKPLTPDSQIANNKPLASVSADDLLAEWDRQAAEAEKPKKPKKPETLKERRKKVKARQKQNAQAAKQPAKVKKAARQKAKETKQHLANALDALKQINKIVGEKGQLGEVDPTKWEQIRPLLKLAWDEMLAAGKSAKEFVALSLQTLSPAGRPYFEKFVREEIANEPVSGENEIPFDEGLLRDREEVAGEPRPAGPGDQTDADQFGPVRAGAEEQEPGIRPETGADQQLHRPGGRTGQAKPGRKPVRADDQVGGGKGSSVSPGAQGTEALAPEDRNHVIAPDDVIAPPGIEGKINANIKAIRLLKQLEEQDRNPTPDEKKILAQYVGWGAFSQKVFNADYHRYLTKNKDTAPEDYFWQPETLKKYNQWANKYGKKLHPQLGGLMTQEEWSSAAASTINAHFTSKEVVTNMWDLAKRLGFKGGTVLEPAAGVGNFFGLMPQDIAQESVLFGVEKDSLSGRILTKLYPQAAIEVGPFEKSRAVLDNSIDLTITNVPFGRVSISDKRHPDYDGWRLHNYFLARSLDATKPGGLMMAITSAWSMDAKSNGNVREYLANKADLIGAIRLPNTAFKSNAGTEVVTDVLVFRKKDSNAASLGHDFRVVDYLDNKEFRAAEKKLMQARERFARVKKTKPQKDAKAHVMRAYRRRYKAAKEAVSEAMTDYRASYAINEYFIKNPEMVLGKHSMKGSMYAANTYTVEPSGDLAGQMAEAVTSFPENIAGEGSDLSQLERVELAGMNAKEGTLTVKDGEIKLIENGRLVSPHYVGSKGEKMPLKPAQLKRVKAYLKLRDLTAETIAAMGDEATTDAQVTDYQRRLNQTYDAYVKKFKAFNGNAANSFLSKLDNDFALVDALEVRVGDGPDAEWVKAPIFTERTVYPFREPDSADSIEDAINLSIIYRGEVSMPYLSELLSIQDAEAIKREIVEKGLGFVNPDTGKVEQRDLYLSGNVKKKLAKAKTLAQGDPSYNANVKALEAVIPEDIDIEFITFRLGSTWLPAEAVQDFIKEVIEVDATVEYVEKAGVSRWHIGINSGAFNIKNRETYASGDISAVGLIDLALNLKSPKVMVPTEDGKSTYEDKEKSREARIKMNEVSDEFVAWAKGHADWTSRLTAKYNEEKNGTVLRKHTAPDIDVYPNASPVNVDGAPLRLREHQKIAVSRALQESVLLAYGVGTGKTFILITTAMEMKRIGTARKPLIVAHNSTIDQYRNSFKVLYPGAKVLIPNDKQRNAKQRKKLLISMATNDWDAIVLPQSFFDGIANDPAREQAFVDEQIAQIEDAIAEAVAEEGSDSWTVKDLETLKENRIQRLDRLLDRRQDEALTFEQMGIDALLVDEVHSYKRSEFYTKLNKVRGIDNGSSQKSTSLILKSQFVRQKTGGKNIITATGTPISNTLAELWTMLRYVRPDLLEDYGVAMFDNFASTFGVVDEDTEQTASGFKEIERFKSYTNGPELLSMFYSGADVRLTKDANLRLPDIKGDKPTMVVNDKSPELTLYIKDIIDRWKAWELLTGREKRQQKHVPIVLYGLAKKAAVDMRLVDPQYFQDDPNSKVNNCVREAQRIYKESADIQGTQVIFCDLIRDNAKAPRFNLHEDLRAKLIKTGIGDDEVVIFESGLSDTKEEAIKDRVRSGAIRVIIGTTERLGIGVDIADKIVAGHHLTVPDRPMDMEQRNGRFIRQSNKNSQVEVLQYATKDTLDAVMFQRLATKQKGADQVLTGDIDGRDFEDPYSAEQADFNEFAAAASGKAGKLLFEKSKLTSQLHKHRIAEQAHIRKVSNARREINQIPELIRHAEIDLANAEQFKAYTDEAFPTGRLEKLTIDGKEMPRKEAYEILTKRIESQISAWEDEFIGKPMGDFRKNAPDKDGYGDPRLSAEYKLAAGDIELRVELIGRENYTKERKPSTKLQWSEVRDRRDEDWRTQKVGNIPISLRFKGRFLGHIYNVGRKSLAQRITRKLNELIAESKTRPDYHRKAIKAHKADMAEYEKIAQESFKYREEMTEIQRRIAEIKAELTRLSSDELLGVEDETAEQETPAPSGIVYHTKSSGQIRTQAMKDLKNGIMRLLVDDLNLHRHEIEDWKEHIKEVKDTPKGIVIATRNFMAAYDYELSADARRALGRLMRNATEQINQGQLVGTFGEPLSAGIPKALDETLPDDLPEGVTRFAMGTAVERRALNVQQVRNVQRAAEVVTAALSKAGVSKALRKQITLDFKPIIDLRGKDIEQTVKEWAAQKKSVSTILGATTFSRFNALVQLSLEQDLTRLERTSYHEALHILARWVLPEAEYGRLMKMYDGNEEAAAEGFADYMAGRTKPIGWLRRIFIKLRNLLRRVGGALRGAGFVSAEDIFGRMAGRAYTGQPMRPATGTSIALMAEQRAAKWYSQMERHLEAKLPGKGTPAQIKKLLDIWAKKGQINAEELEWSGLREWLDDFQKTKEAEWVEQQKQSKQIKDELGRGYMDFLLGRHETALEGIKSYDRIIDRLKGEAKKQKFAVTKADVLAQLAAGRVRIEEVVKGTYPVLDTIAKEMGYGGWTADLTDEQQQEIIAESERYPHLGDATKFAQWQEPGGENYRELLLTLPAKQAPLKDIDTSSWTVETIEENEYTGQRDIVIFDENGNRLTTRYGFRGTDEMAIGQMSEIEKDRAQRAKQKEATYKSTHWDEPNVLAHVRFNERTGTDGERILFIEEIQSDWHQTGRQKGYKGDIPHPKIRKVGTVHTYTQEELKKEADHWPVDYMRDISGLKASDITSLSDRLTREDQERILEGIKAGGRLGKTNPIWVVKNPAGEIVFATMWGKGVAEQTANKWTMADPKTDKELLDREGDRIRHSSKEVVEQQAHYRRVNMQEGMVPDAPYKKTWPLLAMKRMVRYAAEAGFDAIAWTPGEVQAERYDLRKHIDNLYYEKHPDGITIVANKDDRPILEKDKLSERALEDHVGKDLAKKIIDAKDDQGIFDGLDLKVGGQGMRGFYDKILPATVNKFFGKKAWGKAKAETIVIPKTALSPGEKIDRSSPYAREVWHLPITREMRQKALGEGMTLFQVADTTDVFGEVLPEPVEEQMKAARGRDKASVKQRFSDWLKTAIATFTPGQMYPQMPNKYFGKENEILRRFVEIASYSKSRAVMDLKEILNPKQLGPAGYDLFNLKIVLDDMLYDVETEGRPLNDWQERYGELPFGFESADQLRESLARIDQRVAANADVAAALQKRRKIMRKLRRDLVAEGLLDRSVLDDERYFHHEVLQYANLAHMAGVGTGSRDVRTKKKGWQIYRTGSIKDYNTEYMQSEFKVLAQGYSQLETKRILDELDESSNIIGELRHKARQLNYVAIVGGQENYNRLQQLRNQVAYLRGDGRDLDSDTKAQIKALTDEIWQLDPTMPFRQKIAIGMSKMGEPLEDDLEYMDFSEIARLADAGDMGAATVLKAVNERKAFIAEALGDAHMTWQKLMEEREPRKGSAGWAEWIPKPGSAWYLTNSLTDKLLEQVAAGLPISQEEIRQVWTRGTDKRWVVPAELAEVLNGKEFMNLKQDNVVAEAAEKTLNWWKRWILINPFRFFKYNFNNLSGDFDIVLAYDPKILNWTKQAAIDLWAHHYDKPMGPATKAELTKALKYGVIGSGMTVHDIPDITDSAQFDQLISALRADKRKGIDYIKRFWGGSKNFTTWRENVLRLASYRYFQEKVRAGKRVYGASDVAKVDAVTDPDKKAALLARELIGDYGGLSKGGQWLRRNAIPFYSWNEINAPRYWRMFKNLPVEGEPRGRRLRMGGALAKKAGVTTAKMALFYSMVQLFNHLVWPDEEEELGEVGRRQLHLILGRRPDGSIMSVRMQGALSDALSWIGAEDIPQDLADVRSGKKRWWQLLAEAPVSTANRLVQGVRPDIKGTAEMLTGRQVFPDVTKPRPIRDRYEHLARMFSLEPIYRHLAGKPIRGDSFAERILEDMVATFAATHDPGQVAFYQTKSLVIDYLKEQNIERPMVDPTNRANALFYYRRAIQMGDTDAAVKYLKKYVKLGGSLKGLRISVKRQHPLGGLPARHRLRFMAQLNPEDRQTIKRAIAWYRKTYR